MKNIIYRGDFNLFLFSPPQIRLLFLDNSSIDFSFLFVKEITYYAKPIFFLYVFFYFLFFSSI